MASRRYALVRGEPLRLRVEAGRGYAGLQVFLDERPVLDAPDRQALKKGVSTTLPDGRRLEAKLTPADQWLGGGPALSVDGEAVPESAQDPVRLHRVAKQIAYLIASLTAIAGALSLVFPALREAGLGPVLIGVAAIYAVLAYGIGRGIVAALVLAMTLFALDGVIGLVDTVRAGHPPNFGVLVKVLLLSLMWRGVAATRALRARGYFGGTGSATPAEPADADRMVCPKCGHRQVGTRSCEACGIEFEKFFAGHQRMRELQLKLGRPAPSPLQMRCPQCSHLQLETTSCSACGLRFEDHFRGASAKSTQLENGDARPSLAIRLGTAAVVVLALGYLLFLGVVLGDAARAGAFAIVVLLLAAVACGVTALWRGKRTPRHMMLACNWTLGIVVPLIVIGHLSQAVENAAPTPEDVMRATAYIVVETTEDSYTGSGFLVSRKGESALLATNAHVVEPAPGERRKSVTVVFDSGQAEARTFPAEVVGVDRANDLALLRISGDGLAAKPVLPRASTLVKQTQDVLVVGFPFGDALATSRDTPVVTVSKGIVSSVRNDVNEVPGIIQVDADINPGNSGGPVITPTGELIGVARAKVDTTQIGFAIPARRVAALLKGQLVNLRLEQRDRGLTLRSDKVDPNGRIAGARLLLAPLGKSKLRMEGAGSVWAPITDVEIEISFKNTETGTPSVKLPPASEWSQDEYVAQVVLTDGSGAELPQEPFRISAGSGGQVLAGGPGVLSEPVEPARTRRVAEAAPEPVVPTPAPTPEVDEMAGAAVFASPSAIQDVAFGGGGRYVVIKRAARPRLAVFDLVDEQMQELDILGADFLIAANGSHVAVGSSDLNSVRTYDLETLAPGPSVVVPGNAQVRAMAWGANATDAPLMLVTANDVHFLKPDSMAPIRGVKVMSEQWQREAADQLTRHAIQLRAAGSGRSFTFWRTDISPSGVGLVTMMGSMARLYYEHETAGYLAPGPDGQVVYTNLKGLYGGTLKPTGSESLQRRHLVPDLSGRYFIEAVYGGSPRLDLYDAASRTELGTSVQIPEMRNSEHPMGYHKAGLSEDKRYGIFEAAGRLVTVPFSDDRLVVRDVDL
ncbi:MAG: trypsin-like peptidase domain-containing protein [Sinimarinibacterium sp.]|jgi:S1-C subfamily serine protease